MELQHSYSNFIVTQVVSYEVYRTFKSITLELNNNFCSFNKGTS